MESNLCFCSAQYGFIWWLCLFHLPGDFKHGQFASLVCIRLCLYHGFQCLRLSRHRALSYKCQVCLAMHCTTTRAAMQFWVMIWFFPPFRSTAMAVTLAVARLGAILGNVVFGYLIEVSCAVPILLVASLLASGGLLGIKLPNTSNVALS